MPDLAAGKLVLIIGPSGVGKSVILKALREGESSLHFPRSATTRPRREGEDLSLYRFVTDEEFDALLESGEILESAVVHGTARYGTLKAEIVPYIQEGKTVVREIDVQGFDSVRNHALFRGPDAPYRLESIFIVPDDREQLIARIRNRAPISEEELKRRIASMEREMEYLDLCDESVVNREGELDLTVEEVRKLLCEGQNEE